MNEPEFLSDVLRGNDAAVKFCRVLGQISQVWDDLIDRDEETPPGHINAAFFNALIVLPLNPFYRQHFESLHPLLEMAAIDWLTANAIRNGSPSDGAVSYVIRDSLAAVVTRCAVIVGGYDWAVARAPDIRRFIHDEPIESYIGERP